MVTALYRRYRPEAFSEMIGQSQVTEPLMTALRSERIGHAYLFSGPRGCGKTTSARILARCLNCAEGPTDTPCGTCPSCVELSRDGGGSLDVVEIDAASHGGVDDARDLRERAVFAPARDRFKIFIIDEAHMVTPGGFNALLKIVEEPPPHVKFVFATTEPDKVIGTIRSRTHHYPFRLIAPATLIEYVQSLCDSESITVEPGVLPLVVRSGGGSVRDTLSILDQLIAGSENRTVTATRAAGLLGFTHTELLDDVVVALGAGDSAAAFTATDRVVQTGQDPRRFVEDLLERLRDLIVVSATTVQGAAAVFRGVPEDQLQRMFEQAQVFKRGELSRIADIVSEALDRMSGATAPRLQLELMIARALVERSTQTDSGGGSLSQALAAGGAPAETHAAAPTAAQPHTSPAAPAASGSAASASPGAPASAAHPPASAPPQVETPAPPQADSSEMNAAEAARAAREFLRTDSAGTASFGRPVTDVLGMMDERAAATPPPTQPTDASAGPASPAPTGAPTAPVDAAGTPASGGAPNPALAPEPAPQPTPEPASEPASTADAAAAPSPTPAADGDVSFSELADMWPELLEEILETDREAWNAVRVAVPLGLERDMLTIGFASGSDLGAFKASGAGPLRETILAAVGVRVRYVPKQVPPGSIPSSQTNESAPTQQAPRESGEGPSPAAEPSGDTEEPHRAGSSPNPEPQAPSVDDVLARAAARISTLQGGFTQPSAPTYTPAKPELDPAPSPASEPSLAPEPEAETEPPQAPEPENAPASEPPQAPEPMSAPEPESEPATSAASAAPADRSNADPSIPDPAYPDPDGYGEPDDDPYANVAGDPYAEPDAQSAASSPTVEAAPTASETQPRPAADAAPSPPPAVQGADGDPAAPERRSTAPAFTRYGEAVVREVLGAKFIEERPLPARGEG
ncbi:hypothetical protein GCM10009847_09980 [Leucobacter tardus]|uniref:DNA-directed DNA polymerase n=1 Tax=Leucobacter tardus TaxID=501483 RepID=A0A939QJR7_9MICO|nr:DNA polymerase III subunit gamma and tau [Leucobacter tardus]MBO2989196.1 DNA polymerase III subunit gamma and tau [Leucobacter tardus]